MNSFIEWFLKFGVGGVAAVDGGKMVVCTFRQI